MTLSIRPIREKDAETIAQLSTVLGYPLTQKIVQKRIRALVEHSNQVILVAETQTQNQKEVVGFIQAFVKKMIVRPTALEICSLSVNPNMQGKGVGSALLFAVEKMAKKLGCERVVAKSNKIRVDAHAFYKHRGYENKKTQFVFEKEAQ